MNLRGAERTETTGLPVDSLPLLDPRNPNGVHYVQDWEAFLASPKFVSVSSQLEAIPLRGQAVLSEVTTLQARLRELREERKDTRKVLMEAHQRSGRTPLLERVLAVFRRSPDIDPAQAKTQKRDLNTQISKLEKQIPQAKTATQGKLDSLTKERELLRARKETMEDEWVVNRDDYRVVRFAFEQRRNLPYERDRLFETFVRQNYSQDRGGYITSYADLTDLRALKAKFDQMIEEDLERHGIRNPKPKIESAVRQGLPPREVQNSPKVSYVVLSSGQTVTIENPQQLAKAMLPIKGLQRLRASDVLTKMSHISSMSDQDLERFDKQTSGPFKDYYIVPLGQHWWIYYRRSKTVQSFGIQKIP